MLNTVNFLVRYWNGPKWLETEHLMTGPLENWTNCPVFKWTILKVKINKNLQSRSVDQFKWSAILSLPFQNRTNCPFCKWSNQCRQFCKYYIFYSKTIQSSLDHLNNELSIFQFLNGVLNLDVHCSLCNAFFFRNSIF